MTVTYQTELQIQIHIECVVEYILILIEEECGTHGVTVIGGFTTVYRVKGKYLGKINFVNVQNHVGSITNSTSQEIFNDLNDSVMSFVQK